MAVEEELMDLLGKMNKELKNPVDETLLRQILAIVIKNPLDEDRGDCQRQIELLVSQRIGGKQE